MTDRRTEPTKAALGRIFRQPWLPGEVHLEQFTLIVRDYDDAIGYFVDVLGFDLVENSLFVADDGGPKRRVVVRPPGAITPRCFLLSPTVSIKPKQSVISSGPSRVVSARG